MDPAKFKTRKEFIQSRGQDDDAILAEWIWQRWLAKELAYVMVSTQDEDSASGPRYLLVRDDLSMATKAERIEPLADDSQAPIVISEKEELPPSKYQLLFVDYWGTPLTF